MFNDLIISLCCLTVLMSGTAMAESTTYTDTTTGMEFVLIKGGTFLMGDPTGRDQEASPTRKVTVDDFYMGQHEVTFAQYDLFCDDTGREKPDDADWGRDNRPVINVNWHDAVTFTEWLSQKSGKSFRLPSEAEWEYAARGGTTTTYWWGDEWRTKMGVCRGCETKWDGRKTAPVGTFKPNPYGLFDMTGNVYEWILDHKHITYDGAPTTSKPWSTDGKPGFRISRGGSWGDSRKEFVSFARCWDEIDHKYSGLGIRVVMEP